MAVRAVLAAGATCLLLAACERSAEGQGGDGGGQAAPASAGWPQFRGPTRDGVSLEASNFPAGWPPKRLWKKNVGPGCTSPILYGGRVYVMGWTGDGRPRTPEMGADTVRCLDADTGNEIWKQTYAARYQGRRRTGDVTAYGGPSATPALDPDTNRLFTLGVDGDLRCWDAADGGKPLWSLNLYDRYDVPQRPNVGGGRRDYGFTASPLLTDQDVVVEVGAKDGAVMAFDKQTGRRRWASQYRRPAGHSGGPVPLRLAGGDALAVFALNELVVMRLDAGHEGQTLATFPWQTDFGCNIPSPAAAGGRLVVTSAYNRRSTALLDVAAAGIRPRWQSRRHALVASPLVHRDRVFLIQGALTCLNLADGNERWHGGNFGHGSAIATADDRLLAFGRGRLALIDAAPDLRGYRELARVENVVPGTCYPHVAFADGLIACKDRDGNLACYTVRPQ